MRFLYAFLLALLLISCQTSIIPGEKAVKIKNLYAEYFLLADAYFEIQKYEKAATYYVLASKHADYRVQGTYKAARSYAFVSQWENSLGLYEKLLKADPNNKNLLEARAYVTFKSGNIHKSKKYYEELIGLIPDDAALQRNYIQVLIAMRDFTAAQQKLTAYKELFSDETKIVEIEATLAKMIEETQKAATKTDETNTEKTTTETNTEKTTTETDETNKEESKPVEIIPAG